MEVVLVRKKSASTSMEDHDWRLQVNGVWIVRGVEKTTLVRWSVCGHVNGRAVGKDKDSSSGLLSSVFAGPAAEKTTHLDRS